MQQSLKENQYRRSLQTVDSIEVEEMKERTKYGIKGRSRSLINPEMKDERGVRIRLYCLVISNLSVFHLSCLSLNSRDVTKLIRKHFLIIQLKLSISYFLDTLFGG